MSSAGGSAGPPATPPDWISSARWCLVYSASRRSASALTTASRSSPHGSMRLAPLPDVGVVLAHAGPVRGLVDGDLEARMEDDLARAAGVLGHDLGGDVAPPDRSKASAACQAAPAAVGGAADRSAAATDVAGRRSRSAACSKARPSRRAARGPPRPARDRRSGRGRRAGGSCRSRSAAARDGGRGRGPSMTSRSKLRARKSVRKNVPSSSSVIAAKAAAPA